ncbi:SpdD-like protein [Streptomyces sp. 1222.5]|uniref:SpdD-like protein n=1 Tax=Streptomyces sp. 1222.5 TaxID=1881026 RepID=UPI003D742707
MFRPKIPTMPTPTGHTSSPVVEPTEVIQHATALASVPAATQVSSRPVIQLSPGAVIALVGGGAAVVLVVGAVLVSMLLAVAITGASVAVCALVIRSLITADAKRR